MVAIVYYTVSKQTQRFVNKIEDKYTKIELTNQNPFIEMVEPFICIIPSYEQNVLPDVYDSFDDLLSTGDNAELCQGIFASGNRNFAQLFGVTAHEISDKYNIEVLHYFEFQGSDLDVNKIEKELDNIEYPSKLNR